MLDRHESMIEYCLAGSKPVSYAVITQRPWDVHLEYVRTAPGCRRHGYASKLIQHIVERHGAKDVHCMVAAKGADKVAIEAVLRKVGFEPTTNGFWVKKSTRLSKDRIDDLV